MLGMMAKAAVGKLVKKHGLKNLLLILGDHAVKFTPSTKDDKVWKKVKDLLNEL
tara:strand:+ start:402 stop:563 length:162 start_codon:yes stop_codon:yes gene_type:complete